MLLRLLFIFLAALVSYIACDVSHISPSTSYGVPSPLYGQPHTSYGSPFVYKRADDLPGIQAKSFDDFNRDFLGSSQNSIIPSVTPPSAELRLPEVSTNVDFLSPFSTTTQNSLEVGSSTASPLEPLSIGGQSAPQSFSSQSLVSSLSGGIDSTTVTPPVVVPKSSVSNVNVLPEQQTFSGESFSYNPPQNNFDISSINYKPPFGVQQDSFSNFQHPSFIGQGYNFNLPPQSNFGFDQSVSTSTVPSGIDFSAFSTPKPIISEYSNIGINSIPLFRGDNINANFFNNDAALNSASFLGKTSGGALIDAFGTPSSTINPLADSIANLPHEGFPQQSQNVQITKNLYFFAPPEEPEEQAQPRVLVPTEPPKKNYKIIFIKTPEFKPAGPVSIPALPQNEEKTLIYVLQKKPEAPGDIRVQAPPPTAPAKPEVFFIKYKTEEDAQQAVSQVQEAHSSSQTVDNQELLSRFGQKNAFEPQSFDSINEYQRILAQFGTSTPAPVGFQGLRYTSTPFPSGLGFDSSFGTSTVSPLASFKSTVSPSLGTFQFGQNTFESSPQFPSRFGDFNIDQNAFGTSTPSPLGFKSFEGVSSTTAPGIGSFNSFETSTSSPLGLKGFEGFSSSISPGFDSFKSFESSTSAPSLGLKGFESFSSTPSPGFDSFKSFGPSTPSSLGFDSFPSGVSSRLGSLNLGQTAFDTSTPSSLALSSSGVQGLGSFNLGQGSFGSSTPSSASSGFKSFEGVSSVAPELGGFSNFASSTASPLGFGSTSLSGGLNSISTFGGVQTLEPKFGGSIPVNVLGGSPSIGLKNSVISSIVPSSTPSPLEESSVASAGLNSQAVTDKDVAIASNEVEDSGSKVEETSAASSKHEVYGPPRE